MKRISQTFHKMVYEAINNTAPTQVVFGKVTNAETSEIQLEQKIYLTKKQLIFPKNFILENNDKLALIRIQNDNRYLIIGRIE